MTVNNENMFVDEDTYDLVLTLLLKNAMDNHIVLDSRRVKSIVEDTKKVIDGELWIAFTQFGHIMLKKVEENDS